MTTRPAPQITETERAIYERLQLEGETSIRVLYHVAFRVAAADLPSNRAMQQRLGGFIATLNRKLADRGEKVRPGVARRTYCLDTRAAAE